MKKISDKQRAQNIFFAKVKKSLISETGNGCRICDNYANDLAHLLPKGGLYCQYKLEPRNLVLLCRSCHNLYDNDVMFRSQQKTLISQCREFALESDINNYFKLEDFFEQTEQDKISNQF